MVIKNKEGVNTMTEQLVKDFVAAANAEDNEKMVEVVNELSKEEVTTVISTMDTILDTLDKEEKDHEELIKGLKAQLDLVKFIEETKDAGDSAGTDAKEQDSKAEEATQDVAADTSAAEAETPEGTSDVSQGEAEGDTPAEEVKEEQSTDKE